MNIEHPIPAQIPHLRALWQQAFGDSDAALDCFFSTAYAQNRCLCVTEGNAVVAAAYWFDCGIAPYPLLGERHRRSGVQASNRQSRHLASRSAPVRTLGRVREFPGEAGKMKCAETYFLRLRRGFPSSVLKNCLGRQFFNPPSPRGRQGGFAAGKYAYIYAVATAESHRGRGLCHKLMAAIHELLTRQGYAGAMVVPGEESLRAFYAGMGYRDFGGIRRFTCLAASQPAALRKIDAAEFAEKRRSYLPAGAVVQEGENLRYLQSYASFYAGDDFLLTAVQGENELQGLELLGNADAAPGILAALGVKSGSFCTPGQGPFAMYKPLNEENFPTYFGFAFD